MTDAQDQMAHLCVLLPVLARAARTPEQSTRLAGMVDDARGGRDVTDELVKLCRVLGVPYAGPVRNWPWSTSAGHTRAEVFGCPGGTCTRVWVRQPGVPVPRCAVENEPLRLLEP
ncbi:hypothetical protein [Winogradskya humida]|uniref:hypothetical protein n=1 Tax=Winogradskya humida TaxID=113566 RepID=UPI0019435627|nr:hypothetical protein [Actinoplanes humidus]